MLLSVKRNESVIYFKYSAYYCCSRQRTTVRMIQDDKTPHPLGRNFLQHNSRVSPNTGGGAHKTKTLHGFGKISTSYCRRQKRRSGFGVCICPVVEKTSYYTKMNTNINIVILILIKIVVLINTKIFFLGGGAVCLLSCGLLYVIAYTYQGIN